MFLLKSVAGWFAKGPKNLVEVNGTFSDFYKGQWRCLFNTAKATISQGEVEFEYLLTISRPDNGDEVVDPEDESEFSFPLDGQFSMRREKGNVGKVGYSWREASTGKGFLFEVDNNVNEVMQTLFETTTCRCVWEASQKASFPEDGDLEELTERHLKATPAVTGLPFPVHTSTPAPATTLAPPPSSPPPSRAAVVAPSTPGAAVPSSKWGEIPPSPLRLSGGELGDVLFESDVQVTGSKVGSPEENFKADVVASLAIHAKSERGYTFILNLKDVEGVVMFAQVVSNDMYMESERLKVNWLSTDNSGTWKFSLLFSDVFSHEKFKRSFVKCIWETNKQDSFQNIPQTDVDWVVGAFGDINLHRNASGEEEDDEDREDEEDFDDDDDEGASSSSCSSSSSSSSKNSFGSSKDKNSCLAVGYTHSDRSFVAKGDQVGVFRLTDDASLEFDTTLPPLKTASGQPFTPTRMMLHQQDNNLLLLNPSAKNSIFKVDLNRADIVEEWKTDDGFPVTQILPEEKYAQMGHTPTFVGLHQRGMFKIDPRLPKGKQVTNRSLCYKTRVELSCAATTSKGQMAVGDKDGQIRLFSANALQKDTVSDQAPRAKTSLPGFGDPIIGIDVSNSGDWILATCNNYLLLIPAEVKGSTGFETPMGKEKPNPRRLQLQAEHVAAMGGSVNFTPARFNTGLGTETWIVTSSGPYVISWSLEKVKQGKLHTYKIKQYGEDIVANEFKFGEDKSIVVTMPHDVRVARRKLVHQS